MQRIFLWGIAFFILVMAMGMPVHAESGKPHIAINIAARTLEFYQGDALVKEYPIAVGRPSTPSPTGEFEVIEKEVNPWWFPTTPGMNPVPSGPDNPLGYRWIGFSSVYGVHGTNAPWSIGTSASKGCIRMLEEDVEDLFPRVSLGTPVQIIYDTLRVTVDETGGVWATVFEDIYGYGTSSYDRFVRKLTAWHVEHLISETTITTLLREERGAPVKIAQLLQVRVNDTLLGQRGILEHDMILLPANAIINYLGVPVYSESAAGFLQWQGKRVTGYWRSGEIYVSIADIVDLLGAQYGYDDATATVSIEYTKVQYNGRDIPTRIQSINGILSIPVQTLMDVTGRKAEYLPEQNAARISGRIIPVSYQEGIAYLPITQVKESTNIHLFYDTGQRLLQLIYTPYVSGL